MSKRKVYLSWINSILSEVGQEVLEISNIQEGKALCQVIDLLCRDTKLLQTAQEADPCDAIHYLQVVVDHMTKSRVRFTFKVQDILDGDIKSMLDILWLTILNYGIHTIEKPPQERNAGAAKRQLLEWCQKELSTEFDSRNTLTHNLCATGDWFIQLLKKFANRGEQPEARNKEKELAALLEVLEKQLGIRQDIVNPADVIKSNIDEHTLMIYISLLKRKVATDRVDYRQDSSEREKQSTKDIPKGAVAGSPERRKTTSPLVKHSSVGDLADDNSDWFSSSNGSAKSGDPDVTPEGESLIIKTISEQVSEHLPVEGDDGDDEESISVLSGSVSLTTDKKDQLPTVKVETSESAPQKTFEEADEENTYSKDNDEKDEVLQINVDETFLKEEFRETTPKRDTNVKEPLHIVSRTVKRARTTESIMAEAKQKFEIRKQEWQKMEEARKSLEQQEVDNLSITSSDLDKSSMKEGDSKSQEEIEDIGAEAGYQGTFGTAPPYYYPGIGRGMPIFIMPGQGATSPEMQFLLQALRQARHEANFHDQETNRPQEHSSRGLHNLLDLNAVDDVAPTMEPDSQKTKQRIPDTESKVTFAPNATPISKPESSSNVSSLPTTKRGILEVVGDGFERSPHFLELSKPMRDSKATSSESEGDQRKFPRVDIVEPLKEKMQKDFVTGRDRKRERRSPERPSGYRSRSLTPGSGFEEETFPKSILKDRSSSRSKSPSLERTSPDRAYHRERLSRSVDFSQERSPRSSLERSPRSSLDRSQRSSSERSPRSSLERLPRSTLEGTTGKGDKSPRAKSPAEGTQVEIMTSPGRQSRDTDPNRRLVRVLNRELELLKLKMDVLEKSNLSDDTELEDIDKLTKQLSEQVQDKIAKSPEARSPRVSPIRSPRRSSRSPDFTRGRMFRQKKEEGLSPTRSKSETRLHSSTSPERLTPDSHTSRSLQDLSINEAPDGNLTFAPTRRGQPINLGYSSPVRKVSEEIWGMDSSDNLGYDPRKIEKWKKLTNKSRMSDQDVIELKQALATAITENDILQAKLKNSNVEMTEKMEKTNDVLNDCRAHLSRSQAENMELRTQLEKEKTRNESTEERLRENEKQLQASKSSIDDLEAELEQMRNLLAGSSKKDIPTLQSVIEERDNFKNIIANTQRENSELKEDLAREKKLTGKQQSIITDLKNILDDARRERKQLFLELSKFQKHGQLSKVSGIIGKYIENGLYDEEEEEDDEEDFGDSINGYSIKSQPNGFTKDSFWTPQRREIPTDIKMTSTPTYRSRSESAGSSRRLYDDSYTSTLHKPSSFTSGRSTPVSVGRESGYDEMSPPNSARHEIYPHRRTQSYKSNFNSSLGDADDDSVDDLEVQRYLIKRPAGRFDEDDDEQDNYIQRTPKKEMRKSPTLRSKSPNRCKSPKGRDLEYTDLTDEKPAKRQLMYSPYLMNSNEAVRHQRSYVVSPRNSRYDNTKETIECIVESPIDNRYKEEYQRSNPKEFQSRNGDKTFIKALEYAVQQESCNRYYNTEDYAPSYRSSSYGPTRSSYGFSPQRNNPNIRSILKNAKSETNLSIKESINSAHRRSFYSQSASPTRSPSRTPTKEIGSHTYKPFDGSKTCSSPTKPIYSSGLKRGGSLRTSRDIFDDDASPGRPVTPIRYQHQPL
ncbi:uncharacterized protein LOC125670110 isoform X3 [Ostrea edulis]|nr:uncharacterized protein LOC125670110 isoform X3 [Ostrea edulis]XP_048761042.2 uncharacterized protein LOC125670110 isoform X3 [Ostrea edulis]